MFHADEEEEPGGEREEVLHHGPYAHAKDLIEEREAETGQTIEAELGTVDMAQGVDDEEHGTCRGGKGVAHRCSGNAIGGEAEMAEDEGVGEEEVAHHEDKGVERQRSRIRRGDIEGTEQDVDEREEEGIDAPMQKIGCGMAYVGGVHQSGQQRWSIEAGEGEEHGCHGQKKGEAMIEDHADVGITPFSVAAGHENLRAYAEAHAEHEDGDIEDAADGRSAQLHFSDTTEKGGIGHADELLHQHTQQDGICNLPDLAIGVGVNSSGLRHMDKWLYVSVLQNYIIIAERIERMGKITWGLRGVHGIKNETSHALKNT